MDDQKVPFSFKEQRPSAVVLQMPGSKTPAQRVPLAARITPADVLTFKTIPKQSRALVPIHQSWSP